MLLWGCTGRWVPEEALCGKRGEEGWFQTSQKSNSVSTSSKVQVKLSPSIKQSKYISNSVCQILPKFSNRHYLKYSLFSRLTVWRRKQILHSSCILSYFCTLKVHQGNVPQYTVSEPFSFNILLSEWFETRENTLCSTMQIATSLYNYSTFCWELHHDQDTTKRTNI